MGSAAKPLVPKLVNLLNCGHLAIASKSSATLRSLGAVAAPEVAKALSDPERSKEARSILNVMGQSALSAKKELIEALKNKNVTRESKLGIINILSPSLERRDDPAVLKAMVEMSNDSDSELRGQARHRILYPNFKATDLDDVFSKTSKFTLANKLEILWTLENHPNWNEAKTIVLKLLSDPEPQIVQFLYRSPLMQVTGLEGMKEIERLIKKENRQDLIPLLQRFQP
jgi:hypothetical protein